MAPIETGRHTFIAPFVNAEIPGYLVIEDSFPNGRPAFEDAGVYKRTKEGQEAFDRFVKTIG